MPRHLLSGLVVATDTPIVGAPETVGERPPDLVVRTAGRRPVPATIADGRLLQAVRWGDAMQYSTVERADGTVLLRLHGLIDFVVEPDLRTVTAWTDPSCEPEMLGILVAGNMLAMVLALRGETVLHASAVEVGGRAVAFVAHSGMGKSTLAALACARGARLVTDDLLRLDMDGDGVVRCLPGAPETRLRRPLTDLVEEPVHHDLRTSVDGREVWSPPATTADAPDLAAVVLPVLDPDRLEPALELLAPSRALLELTQLPRILGVRDNTLRARGFANLSRLVRSVPVFSATIPWGPPFDPTMIDAVLAEAGMPLSCRGMPTPAS